ncbi:MAG: hypothetical protein R3C53_07475 [Pirellulaceae bacterium]
MKNPKRFGHFLLHGASIGLLLVCSICIAAPNPDVESGVAEASPRSSTNLAKSATWNWPDVSAFEEQLISYLDQQSASSEVRSAVQEYWKNSAAAVRGPELLDRLLDASAIIEPRLAELISRLRSPGEELRPLGELPWLTSDVPGWLQDTVRLAYGRAMAQRQLIDESLETLAGLDIQQVCDPASLLFYRATCEHHLLKKTECLSNVRLLLEREQELPTRFAQVAHLIEADIQPLEDDSLSEVSRLMFDVRRRLDLGRAGKRVREEEQDIVDKLDKLIEKIEQQMQQQQQQQASANGQQPNQAKPMEESQVAGGSGPGDVDQKELDERGNWGNLPPAQRQEALQRLTEELPSHYREVIEGYFRQLAKDRS